MEGLPSSIAYTNNSRQPNQESSSSKLLLHTTSKRRNIESGGILGPTQTKTLDQHHRHQFNAQHQQQTQRGGGRESTQDPDQPQLASATTAGASNSNTPPPQAQPEANHVAASIRYRECLKNHAASIGGHVVDGCGEFMPSGEEGTTEALKCAACECHRNFHRRETQGGESQQMMASFYQAYNHNGNIRIRTTSNHHIQPPSSQQYPHPYPHHHHHHQFSHHYSQSLASPTSTGGQMMMAFGGAVRGPAESSSEDLNMFHSNTREAQPMAVPPSFSVSKKRFRTKFSKEQKDRMHEIAEMLGWKIQKQDDEQVRQLCDELGVKRQVFKVWMHNNKQAMKRKHD